MEGVQGHHGRMLTCRTGARRARTSGVQPVSFTFKLQIPASRLRLSNFPLDISRCFCLIVFTVQTLLCDCFSRENRAESELWAERSRQPLHSRASLPVLRDGEGPDSGCQLLPDAPPSFLLSRPATFVPTSHSQWTRSLASTGSQGGVWASKNRQRVSAIGLLTLHTRDTQPPPWAHAKSLMHRARR